MSEVEYLEELEETYKGNKIVRKKIDHNTDRLTRKFVLRDCVHCNTTFTAPLNSVRKGNGQYCSRSCVSSHRMTGSSSPTYRGKIDFVNKLKEERECSKKGCNESRPEALCFHHKNPDNKIECVSRMAMEGQYTLDDVKEEVKKCSIICVNCHKIEHSNNKTNNDKPEFKAPENQLNLDKYEKTEQRFRGKTVYLSESKHRHIIRLCKYCNQEFLVAVGEVKRGQGKYHSRSCAAKGRIENGELSNKLGTRDEDSKAGIIRKRKKEGSCCRSGCNESRKECLEFHHKSPDNKVESITNIVKTDYTKEELQAELKKCNIICRNCHQIKHSQNKTQQ